MKKTLFTILAVLVFITLSGFKGCNYFEIVHNVLVKGGYATGKYNNAADNTETYYGIIVGEEGKINTSEGRPPAPWIVRQSGVIQDLNDVKIYSDSTFCCVVGKQGVVLCSPDKGHNWTTLRVPNSNYPDLNGVGIIPQMTPINIVSAGDLGTVLKSSNNGTNWSWINISINTTKRLNSVAIVTGNVFTVAGDSGAIYRTLDGGVTWENRSISSSISLKKIVSLRYDLYCAVGTGGSIYTSSDYGYSWQSRISGTTRTFRDVMFSSVDSGVAAGDAGVVRHTTNGGVTWLTDSYLNGLTSKNIINIAQVDVNTINSLTISGTAEDNVIDTTYFLAVSSEPFLGIEPISNFIAEVFSLKQNYPNPFNPVTNIEISVPEASFVKLIIYDIQGREIETLVNEELRAGGYKIDWNASSYPSGVYFYSIYIGDYKATKKMVLLK